MCAVCYTHILNTYYTTLIQLSNSTITRISQRCKSTVTQTHKCYCTHCRYTWRGKWVISNVTVKSHFVTKSKWLKIYHGDFTVVSRNHDHIRVILWWNLDATLKPSIVIVTICDIASTGCASRTDFLLLKIF